ncbi:MAG: group II intron reverse transcriptase/maturase [Desulfitobacteriia bacterium]|jgi:RNA-directed DNA polymerase
MQTSLRGIATKAKQDKKHRFGNLYGLINRQALYQAWADINKKAAAGVDKETAKEFTKNLDHNLNELLTTLKEKKYKAKLVRRVHIPKGDGKTRPLGIPAVKDKVLQRAAARILEAIYEQDFQKCSYGYRPGTGPQKAVQELTKEIQGKYSYIVEADIKGFFDNIDHGWLMEMLKQRIKDTAFLRLINKWLKAGILETDGKVIHPITGCPQGAIISPVLANIYLHYTLDIWFEKIVKPRCQAEAYLCRFADDFICAFRYKRDAERFYKALARRLNKFGLEMAKEKTKIISFSRFRKHENTSFEFLGFEYRWKVSHKGKDIIARRTSRNKLRKSIKAFTAWCKENRNNRLRKIVGMLNTKLRGYFNYYGVIGNSKGITEFYNIALKILYKWLNRRSQRKSFNWKEFEAKMKWYGLVKPRITENPNKQLQIEWIEDCFA